jgi:DNA polymerase III subunit delta'
MLNDVRGQSEGVRVLQRVVEGHLKSPLLLVGTEGVGRKYSVIEAARQSFCKGDPASPHSKRIDEGVHPDLVIVQPPDDKELGVDAIRAVVSQAETFPSLVPARYVVIERADKMTTPAANALLKTLEEQPPTTRFFLLAESPDFVLPTIRSRCGLVRYRPLPEKFVVEYVKDLTDDPTKALVCCRLGEGSVGLAYQFLASGRLTLRNKMVSLLELGLAGDFSSLFSRIDEIENDLQRGLHFLSHLLCDIIMLPHAPDRITNLDIAEKLGGLGTRLGEGRTEDLLSGLNELRGWARGKTLPFHTKTYLASVFSR